MRTELADQAKAILVITEQDQILAHDPDGQRVAARQHLLRRGDRLPIAP
jgi:hypothetical protein